MDRTGDHPALARQGDRPERCLGVLGPDLLTQLLDDPDPAVAGAARAALERTTAIRRLRQSAGRPAGLAAGIRAGRARPVPLQQVFDAGGGTDLPGTLRRSSGDEPASDPAVNEAFDGVQATYDLYREAFGRSGIDGADLQMRSSVHYDVDLDNAFWDGQQMVFGDGSGRIFLRGALTRSVDVIGHELTHGITQATAKLRYHGQPGALNESMSDVFGSLVKQRLGDQTVSRADWLIGAGTLGPALRGRALRSLKAPGTANRYDTQPAHMDHYVASPDTPMGDWGGVHTNSGIPNRAFYLAAAALRGRSWEHAGPIWFRALTTALRPSSTFADAADATIAAATDLHGASGRERAAVETAWRTVGVI